MMATNVESVTVASITCAANGVATIAGTGTMDGAPVDYVITVQDAGEPGTGDKYGIELSVGGTLVYDSGFRPLDSGNVQIHK